MYLIIKIFSKIINILPIGAALALGKVAGLALYFNRNKRETGFRNLKSVFPHKNNRELFSILRSSLISFGMSVIESFIAEKIIEKGWVDSSSISKIKSDNNAIIVGIHAGSWEIYNQSFARRYKLAIIAQRQKNNGVDRFLNEERQRDNIAVCFSLKSLVRYLHKGYWAGIVVDQGAEDNALYIDFFSNLIPVPGGAVYLAKKFNKKIYTLFGYRKKQRFHYIEMGETLDCSKISDYEALRQLNSIYEAFLTKYPRQYVWWYKRFKKKRNIRIVVLSDGKPGHFKQSLAVKSFLEELGYRVDAEIVEIKGLSRFRRFIIEMCALILAKKHLGNMSCIKALLDKDVYDKLSKLFADMVVSTGSSLSGVNMVFSGSLGAKSIVVLKPNLPVNKFDLVIIPEHDRLKAENVVNIKGALSSPLDTEKDSNELSEHFKLSRRDKIALFIGGPIAGKRDFNKNIKAFIDRIKDFAAANDLGILVTTSRRTPVDVENLIETELGNSKNTEVIIIANKKNYSFVLGGFLASSSLVFVTSDSISMISESLGAGKTTVCVELEDILDGHHINFIQSVGEILNIIKPPYHIDKFNKPSYSILDYNSRIVKEAIKSIL